MSHGRGRKRERELKRRLERERVAGVAARFPPSGAGEVGRVAVAVDPSQDGAARGEEPARSVPQGQDSEKGGGYPGRDTCPFCGGGCCSTAAMILQAEAERREGCVLLDRARRELKEDDQRNQVSGTEEES